MDMVLLVLHTTCSSTSLCVYVVVNAMGYGGQAQYIAVYVWSRECNELT